MKINTKLSFKLTTGLLLFGCMVGSSARAQDAGKLWSTNCASCHGKDGKGQTMMGKKLSIGDLSDSTVQAGFTDAQATKDIKEGVTENGKVVMKAFGSKLSDADIKALVAYTRSLKK